MIANLIVEFIVFHEFLSIHHIEPNPALYGVSEELSLTSGESGSCRKYNHLLKTNHILSKK